MRVVETSGKTVEEAVNKALAELALPRDRVEVEVLVEPSSGLFGLIGAKQAKVRVTEIVSPKEYMHDFLKQIMKLMQVNGKIEIEEEKDIIKFNVTGQRMGILIGKRGQTLNALQYLLNVIYHKKFPDQDGRLILDVENYRAKREETLRTLAVNLAKKAVRTRREIVLEPMTPQERRIIHTALQEHRSVITFSEGSEPYRKVIIAPK